VWSLYGGRGSSEECPLIWTVYLWTSRLGIPKTTQRTCYANQKDVGSIPAYSLRLSAPEKHCGPIRLCDILQMFDLLARMRQEKQPSPPGPASSFGPRPDDSIWQNRWPARFGKVNCNWVSIGAPYHPCPIEPSSIWTASSKAECHSRQLEIYPCRWIYLVITFWLLEKRRAYQEAIYLNLT
jgi:hypothetical protein